MPAAQGRREMIRTKVVATIGPACRHPEMLDRLIAAGVDVFRVNMAHGTRAEHDETVNMIHAARERAERPVAVLVDLAGPKIRLGQLMSEPLECRVDDKLVFVPTAEPAAPNQLTSTYPTLIDELSVGHTVLLADGTVTLEVCEKVNGEAHCRVVSEGTLRSRQGINLPGVPLSVASPTPEDLDHAVWAVGRGVDFLGLSFVRTESEVSRLRQEIDKHQGTAHIVAKIEKPEALNRLEYIVAEADAVMVARGDLGVEIDVAEIAVVQKRIISTCALYRKPVIVATQMLDSMQHARRPTRAEATDVANAILDGADACMLSGETAIGDFPLESVKMMKRIMQATEPLMRTQASRDLPEAGPRSVHPVTAAVVFGASRVAMRLQARLIVIATRSGATALAKAKQRDFTPAVGVSDSEVTLRKMCLMWGVKPLPGMPLDNPPELRRSIEEWGCRTGLLATGDRVIFVTGTGVIERAHNSMVIHEVE